MEEFPTFDFANAGRRNRALLTDWEIDNWVELNFGSIRNAVLTAEQPVEGGPVNIIMYSPKGILHRGLAKVMGRPPKNDSEVLFTIEPTASEGPHDPLS